jgi:hypothetical protein
VAQEEEQVQTAGYTYYHKVKWYGYTSQYDTLDNDRGEKSENIAIAHLGIELWQDPPKNCQYRHKETRCMCNIHIKICIHNFKVMWEVSSKINIGQCQHHNWLKECHTDIHLPATLSSLKYSYCCVAT